MKVDAPEIVFSISLTRLVSWIPYKSLNKSLTYYVFNFFKSTGTVFDLSTSKSSALVFRLFKLFRILPNLLIYSLSTSAFKAVKSPSVA